MVWNLCWWARRDSNPRPSVPETDALSTELRTRDIARLAASNCITVHHPTPNMSAISRNSRVYALPHRLHWSGMDIAMNDFEYERRFFCRALPPELDDGEPMLIVQS